MNTSQKAASAALRAMLANAKRSEAAPSAAFLGAGHGPDGGPHDAEVAAAIQKLADAEAANDAGPLARALAAVVAAVR